MVVGIYCRISVQKIGDKSIEDQSKLGIQFCENLGYTYFLYVDEGISGTSEDRPEFQRLILDISDSRIQCVWVFDDSRLQRNPETRYVLLNLFKKYQVMYVTHIGGEVDLDNAEENLMGGLMAEFNKYHVSITKHKVRSVLKRRALGGRGWGIPPYGYAYGDDGFYVIKDEEATIIKKIFEWSLSGIGTDSIARKLNEDSVPTRYNQYSGNIRLNKSKGINNIKLHAKSSVKWAGNTIRGIIRNPVYYGFKRIKDIRIEVPPLMSFELWESANYNLTTNNSNSFGKGGTKKHKYLLNKILKCSKCGRNFNGKTRVNKRDHHYYCMGKRSLPKCQNRSINIDKIEQFVWRILFMDGRIWKALNDDQNTRRTKVEIQESLNLETGKLNEAKQGRTNVLQMVESGVLTQNEVLEKMQEIRMRINFHEEKISELSKLLKQEFNFREEEINAGKDFFESFTHEKKKVLIEKYVKHIYVDWIETIQNQQLVRYYKIVVTYNLNNISEIYTNGYGLDLNKWFKVNYDKSSDEVWFDYSFEVQNEPRIIEIPFWIDIDGNSYSDYSTLAPFGNSSHWTEVELADYYGKKRYFGYKEEIGHKLNSGVFKVLPQH